MSEPLKIRCKHCLGLNLYPAPPEPEPGKLIDAAIDKLLTELTHAAVDPSRIGQRVILLQYARQAKERREKLKLLAARLGVSSATACTQVSRAEEMLQRIGKANPATPSTENKLQC